MIVFDTTAEVRQAIGRPALRCASRALGRALRKRQEFTVAIRFVSRREMRELNRRYRGVDRPTDVLSFAFSEVMGYGLRATGHLGDIVICPAYARQEAARRAIPLPEELLRLVVHGVLHLGGWDHERPSDEQKMFRLQERLVESCQSA